MTQLNWFWIAVAATTPSVVGLLVAFPFWRKQQPIFGSIAGTAVCFGAGVALILREYVELDRQVRACLDAGMVCWPEPSAFTRFAIYAGVALLQIFALFSLGLIVDERVRRRGYAPEWR